MILCYDQLKDKPTVLLSFTGLTIAEFEELFIAFEQAWKEIVNETTSKPRKRKKGGGRKPAIEKMENRLLFILFYLKTYPLQEVIAFFFGISQGQANEWIHRLATVLKKALANMKQLPERKGENLVELLKQYESMRFTQDATERKRQRPKQEEKQREYYSGKKKAHTVKNNLVVHPDSRRVCYLSETVPGKKHDKKLADEGNLTWPKRATLEQDTGYQGFELESVIILQPKKKPRKKELTFAEKFINRAISSGRIIVENVIAGIKRCRILKDVFRNTKDDFADLVMEIACGLHNFRVDSRSPHEDINLVDFYFQ
jgi:hypothetical protein